VDTGSGYTLIRESVAKRMGNEINKRRNTPSLQGVTGSPLRVLGMIWLEIGVGEVKTHKQWFPVVPDHYLNADLLLGCDVLGQAPLTWDGRKRAMLWGNVPYIIHHIKKQRGKVERIKHVPLTAEPSIFSNKKMNLPSSVKVPPYQSQFIPFQLKEPPGTTLLVYPQPRVSHNSLPFLTKVNDEKEIYLPFVNNTKSTKEFKLGTLVGSYEKEKFDLESVLMNHKIHNDLLPESDQSKDQGERPERLRELIKRQDWSHLTKSKQKDLTVTLLDNDVLFITHKSELGLMKGPPAKISVADPTPSRGPSYRYPEQAKQLISGMLQDMEEREIIEKSTSAWLSPIVLVNKPDGSKRMCLDYRHVNKHLSTDIYPLPRLEELVEQAAGHEFYATLDMREAYFQILLDENSRDLTTFSDGMALYRFRRLPFGLSCSPAIFSRHMSSLLSPLLKKGWVKNYLDDLIIWAPDFATLVSRLRQLFSLLSKNGVKLNLSKCEFGKREVTFLGYRISGDGCQPDPKNVEAIQKMKAPTKVKEVRRFLGMCGFYRKHVPNFAKIAAPLTNLTRSTSKFDWSDLCQVAFETLKELLTCAPVLVRAQTDKPFIVTTDASNTHVGGVLSQIQTDGTNKPVGYFSKKLNSTECRYSATDKEALAVLLTCRNFHHYLWGNRFTVVTDHQPLTSIFKRKTKSPRMNRWILEMREYNYEIQYVKGKYNYVADQLSRPVRVIQRSPDVTWLGSTKEEFRDYQREEIKWRELVEYLEGGRVPTKRYHKTILDQFVVMEEILYYVREKTDGSLQYCLVVPQRLKGKALQHVHEISGHLGQKKTICKAEELFYWCNLKVDVCHYVKECITCQRFKGHTGLQQPWQELPPVNKPLERIGIDLTDMVAGAQGFRYILTVVDHYSRYVKFYPLKTKHTQMVVEALDQYVADFGVPQGIVLDNGGEFTSHAFQQFCQHHLITLHYTTPYHPQGNGMVERMHRTLKSVLSTLCQGHPLRWPRLLQSCQSVMNSAVHTSTGHQPFYAFFSRHAPRLAGMRLPATDGEEDDVAAAHQNIRDTHVKMSRKYRSVANRKRKEQRVDVETLVWVKRETAEPGTCTKLNVRWDGPYKVVEVIRDGGAYMVQNPFTGQQVQRAAEKVKPYYGSEEWLLEPQDTTFTTDLETEPVPSEHVELREGILKSVSGLCVRE